MTKKDFVLIADCVRTIADHDAVTLRTGALAVADVLAARLASTNPRFDRARFLAACGVQNGEG